MKVLSAIVVLVPIVVAPRLPARAAETRQGAGEVDALIRALSGGRPAEIEPAARRLARLAIAKKLGRDKARVIKALAKALRHADPEVSDAGGRALAWMGADAIDPLVAALRTGHRRAQSNAALNLCLMTSIHKDDPAIFDKAIPALSKFVRHEYRTLRTNAIHALAGMGPAAIPALFESLADEGGLTAAKGIARHGTAALPALLKALKSKDARTRAHAAVVAKFMGPQAKEAVPLLIQLLKGTDKAGKVHAAQALRAIGKDAKAAAPHLVALLREPDVYRTTVARALATIGPAVEHADPLLEALSTTTDEREQNEIATAIAAIGARAVPKLTRALEDERFPVRRGAAFACLLLGPDAAGAVPALIKTLHEDRLRRLVAEALGRIGPAAKDAVPFLVQNLKKDHWWVSRARLSLGHRSAAAQALGRIGEPAIPALLKGLGSDNDLVRIGCAMALGQIGPKAGEAAPALARLLTATKRANLRYCALQALLAIEADAGLLIPKLRLLVNDPHPTLARAASQVLRKLQAAQTRGRDAPPAIR